MTIIDRAAVITAHNRPELLARTVAAIGPQVDAVIVVDNASDPPVRPATIGAYVDPDAWNETWRTLVVQVPDQPPNLSRNWNIGIRSALELGARWVAVLGDDAIVPAGWLAAVTEAMAETGAVIGCSGSTRGRWVKTEPDGDLHGRMPGHAWILDGRSDVRPDEAFSWWWGDTDLDWRARSAGGMVKVAGYDVPNAQPDHWLRIRPELAAQVAADSQAFVDRYGWRPW